MLPRATEVEPMPGYLLAITFPNGEFREFDMRPFLDFGVFQKLKDEAYFRQVRVENSTITWPNEQDICPDTLYLDSKPVKASCVQAANVG
jgi:hypothetical protein